MLSFLVGLSLGACLGVVALGLLAGKRGEDEEDDRGLLREV